MSQPAKPRPPQPTRPRRMPQRTCIVTRAVLSKREMVRLVRTPDDGVQIDPTGKRTGRGAYIRGDRATWRQASKNNWAVVARALKTEITEADCQRLAAFADTLPETID